MASQLDQIHHHNQIQSFKNIVEHYKGFYNVFVVFHMHQIVAFQSKYSCSD